MSSASSAAAVLAAPRANPNEANDDEVGALEIHRCAALRIATDCNLLRCRAVVRTDEDVRTVRPRFMVTHRSGRPRRPRQPRQPRRGRQETGWRNTIGKSAAAAAARGQARAASDTATVPEDAEDDGQASATGCARSRRQRTPQVIDFYILRRLAHTAFMCFPYLG